MPVYTGGNFVYDEILPDKLSRVTHAAELAQTPPGPRRGRLGLGDGELLSFLFGTGVLAVAINLVTNLGQ